MPRRDAFSMLRGSSSPSPENEAAPAKFAAAILDPTGIKPLNFIPAAEPRKKRDRKWEKAHQGQVATYRGIPAETHQTILHIADSLGVALDEVARAFLKHSLVEHKSGRHSIIPHPKAQRMTLYPDGKPEAVPPSKAWLSSMDGEVSNLHSNSGVEFLRVLLKRLKKFAIK